jgi:glycerophosphoryl diester phosphodiesterase
MQTTKAALIVGHRGDRSRAHENTVRAMQFAIECGADMVEFDVRRTADGELVVHHDDRIGESLLAEITYPEALGKSIGQGYEIPRLADVLDVTRGRVRLDVELKETGYESRVVREIFDRRFSVSDFVLTSFDSSTILNAKSHSPGIRAGLLLDEWKTDTSLEAFTAGRVDFLAPKVTLLDPAALAETSKRGIPLLVWTVNDEQRIRELLRISQIFAIVTDDLRCGLRLRNELRD